jgi:hypothetical protein
VAAVPLGGLGLVVIAVAALAFAETANVRIAAPAQKLEAQVSFNTGEHAGLALEHLRVHATELIHGNATGTIAIGAKFASGQVTLSLVCSVIPPCVKIRVLAGAVVQTPRGVRYKTLSSAFLQQGAQTVTVGVRAVVAGPSGNVGANSITVGNSAVPMLKVMNRLPVTGGVGPTAGRAIQQSDMDAVRAALVSKANTDLSAALLGASTGMTGVIDGPPSFAFNADHAVGSQVSTFTVTVTGEMTATVFSDEAAQAIVRAGLQPMVWPGYDLRTDPVQADYQITSIRSSTDVTISADAVAYALPKVPTSGMRAALAGRGESDARGRLSHDFRNSKIDIHVTPFALPWLPFIAEHINLTLSVEPVPAD